MEALYRLGRATVSDVQRELPNAPTDSAIRAMLRILQARGWVDHATEGRKNVYWATVSWDEASRSAFQTLLRTFFHGSTTDAMAAILDDREAELDDADLARLEQLIAAARSRRPS